MARYAINPQWNLVGMVVLTPSFSGCFPAFPTRFLLPLFYFLVFFQDVEDDGSSHPSIQAYDDLVNTHGKPFMDACGKVDGLNNLVRLLTLLTGALA